MDHPSQQDDHLGQKDDHPVQRMLLQVASKCESFAMTLLDKCTTKHEIQTLLQTKYLSFS